MSGSKTRILFIHSSDEMYGSDRVLLQLVSGLDFDQFEPIVVLPADIEYGGKLSEALHELGVISHHVKMAVLRRRYFSFWGLFFYLYYFLVGTIILYRFVKRYKINLIHSNTSAVLCGGLVSRFCQLPHVWHVHEILTEPHWLAQFIYHFIRANASCVVAISQAVGDSIVDGTSDGKLEIIWNGVDLEKFSTPVDRMAVRQIWGANEETVAFGVVGRVSGWKGQSFFLDAAAKTAKGFGRFIFVIVGSPVPGEEEQLTLMRQKAVQLGIGEQVCFIPYVDNIGEIMAAIDVLVLPSILPEPFGLVVLEAMASHRPVIATAHGGPLEVVLPGKTGLLVPPKDIAALANAMLQLACQPEQCHALGEAGYNRAVTHFSLGGFQEKFNSLYTRMINNYSKKESINK